MSSPQVSLQNHIELGTPHNHAVQFYDGDAYLTSEVARYLAEGLRKGDAAIVIATQAHKRGIMGDLKRLGLDWKKARDDGQLVTLDARQTLATFMTGDLPDPNRFDLVVGGQVRKAIECGATGRARAYGEMVDLLWKDGNATAAITLERFWNDLLARYDLSLLCAYAMNGFANAADEETFRAVCETHTHVLPTESYSSLAAADQLREITLLQQRAQSLEAELTHRARLEAQLQGTLDSLKQREAELTDVLENAAEGIHMVSADGIIEWANQAELDMLGYSREEYVGHPIAEFHADSDIITDVLARLGRGETIREYEAPMRCRDGSIRHLLINSNVKFEDGNFIATRCFSKDITEIKKAAIEREALLESERLAHAEAVQARQDADRARRAAEDANRVKSEFLAVMSHELRTPLNAIGGYAELMELGVQGPVSKEQRELLERIQRNQRHLLGLINQVLNYARIETGNLRFDITDVPLDEVLSTTEALIFPQLRAKGVRYKYSRCDASVTVRADAEKLQQILLNLLANAVKFTERGGLIAVIAETDENAVTVKVRDTGIGIAPDKLVKIFEPFVQVDPNYTREYEGVGLGLAVSRDLAKGMDATLDVESSHGEGSTFILTLKSGNALPVSELREPGGQ